ncbi:MAG: MutL protein [Acholeplasma sp.]|jgi:uncharacterized protein (TIGR01319 family)|nr:MAG: MutL protein [Acholeplasma sp.]
MSYFLLVDFGSTYTKLTAVDLEKQDIIATSKAMTTVETDITLGYEKALDFLYKDLGQKISFEKVIACSSAAGGLKMAAIGLVEELTTEAAKRVCLGAGAKVELVLSHHINQQEVKRIADKNIDIILLAGGADGGNSECVIHNAAKLAKSTITAPIVFAGNKDAMDEIDTLLKDAGKEYYLCENVMPKLNQLNTESAREKIKDIFVRNIIEAKGIKKVEILIDQVVLPTPHAVLMAAELLSKGYGDENGLGELMMVDVGGATTDVYSLSYGLPTQMNAVMTGLEEPYAKRTVEGDLGMRYSALGVLQSMTVKDLESYKAQGYHMEKELQMRHEVIDWLPVTQDDLDKEDIIAGHCVSRAVSRHVGNIKQIYTPLGMMLHQTGKDLTNIEYFIGTGGVIIHSENPKNILVHALKNKDFPMELRPNQPKFLLDHDYILSAMGLLSMTYPKIALAIMKKRMIHL